jgi:hypothetical protein
MNLDEITELQKAIHENTKAFREMAEAIRRERSPWADPEEAADLLGIPRTKGKYHRRRLARLVDAGILNKVRTGKTPFYWKEELRKIAHRIAVGEITV